MVTREKTIAAYVSEMDPGIAICRARRRHDWPSDHVWPGAAMPKGMETARQHDGSFQITEYCRECETESTWETKPRGVFDRDMNRRYKHPRRWVTIPREIEATSRDIKGVILGMVQGELFGRNGAK